MPDFIVEVHDHNVDEVNCHITKRVSSLVAATVSKHEACFARLTLAYSWETTVLLDCAVLITGMCLC